MVNRNAGTKKSFIPTALLTSLIMSGCVQSTAHDNTSPKAAVSKANPSAFSKKTEPPESTLFLNTVAEEYTSLFLYLIKTRDHDRRGNKKPHGDDHDKFSINMWYTVYAKVEKGEKIYCLKNIRYKATSLPGKKKNWELTPPGSICRPEDATKKIKPPHKGFKRYYNGIRDRDARSVLTRYLRTTGGIVGKEKKIEESFSIEGYTGSGDHDQHCANSQELFKPDNVAELTSTIQGVTSNFDHCY